MNQNERNLEKAVVALLEEKTQEKAAKRVGISKSTMRRWMADSEFKKLLKDVQQNLLQQTVCNLHHIAGDAVDTLKRNMQSDSPSVQVRAALGLLEYAFRGSEIVNIINRLDSIEERLGGYGA